MYEPGLLITELQPLAPINHIEISIPPAPQVPSKKKKKNHADSKGSKVKRNRKSITLDIKLEIIKRFENGQKVSEITRRTGLSSSTISSIISNKDKIINCTFATEPSQFSSIKILRRRSNVMENMERLITFWMEDRSQKGIPFTIGSIRQKAISLFNDLKSSLKIDSDGETFSGSKGWIEKFKNRHNLNTVKLSAGSPPIDIKAAEKYPDYFHNLIVDNGLSAKQVFNIDEVELYWKRMPERAFLTQEEKAEGSDSYMDKVTLILVTNAEGDFKIKPLLVYHSEYPRAMKRYVKNMLPVSWFSHPKGLVSTKIFEDYLTLHFFPAAASYLEKNNLENKGLLILDYAPSHLLNMRHSCGNFLVKHIPKNTTTIIQPMDQGIASTFKANYLKKVFQQMLNECEKDNAESIRSFWREYDIISAVYHMADSWMEIDASKINGAWRNVWPQCVYEANTFDQILIDLNNTHQIIVLWAKEIGFRDIVENDVIELLNCQGDDLSNEILIYIDKERAEEDIARRKLNKSQLTEPVLRDVLKNFDKGLKILADHDSNIDRSTTISNRLNEALKFYRELQKELIEARQIIVEDSFYDSQIFASIEEPLQNVVDHNVNKQNVEIVKESITSKPLVEIIHNEEDEVWPGEDDDYVNADDFYVLPNADAAVKDDEFEAFSKSIATQLRQLPQEIALELMAEIQQMIVRKRLEVINREKKSKADAQMYNNRQIQNNDHAYVGFGNNMY